MWHDRLAFALPRALQREPETARALLSELRAESPSASATGVADVVELAKRQIPSVDRREAWIARFEAAAGGSWRPAWDGMLRFEDLRALHAAGHEIGSHSLSHPLLPDCSDQDLEREVRESKEQLEREIRSPVTSFCYPNGSWDARVREAVQKAGYARAVTTCHGWNARSGEWFALRRCDLSYDHCVDRSGSFSPARLALRLCRAGSGGSA